MKAMGNISDLLSPLLIAKVLRSLDRTAMVMMIVAWSAAMGMMGIAIYTVKTAGRTSQQAEAAAALEPVVPTMQRTALPRADLEKLADRLASRYRGVSFVATPDNTLDIANSEPNNFMDWLASLSYLDTIAPEARWTIRDLCIGSECGQALMRARIVGERVTFKAPAQPDLENIGGDGESAPAKP
ncbi:MAG: hypothetical protein WDO70_04595 [Alphaproteobacteria bacterium]